jgi:hypothetical protein
MFLKSYWINNTGTRTYKLTTKNQMDQKSWCGSRSGRRQELWWTRATSPQQPHGRTPPQPRNHQNSLTSKEKTNQQNTTKQVRDSWGGQTKEGAYFEMRDQAGSWLMRRAKERRCLLWDTRRILGPSEQRQQSVQKGGLRRAADGRKGGGAAGADSAAQSPPAAASPLPLLGIWRRGRTGAGRNQGQKGIRDKQRRPWLANRPARPSWGHSAGATSSWTPSRRVSL